MCPRPRGNVCGALGLSHWPGPWHEIISTQTLGREAGESQGAPITELKFYTKGRNPKDVEVITCGEEK